MQEHFSACLRKSNRFFSAKKTDSQTRRLHQIKRALAGPIYLVGRRHPHCAKIAHSVAILDSVPGKLLSKLLPSGAAAGGWGRIGAGRVVQGRTSAVPKLSQKCETAIHCGDHFGEGYMRTISASLPIIAVLSAGNVFAQPVFVDDYVHAVGVAADAGRSYAWTITRLKQAPETVILCTTTFGFADPPHCLKTALPSDGWVGMGAAANQQPQQSGSHAWFMDQQGNGDVKYLVCNWVVSNATVISCVSAGTVPKIAAHSAPNSSKP